jgi:D-alanyl-D-alanine dipeptidase
VAAGRDRERVAALALLAACSGSRGVERAPRADAAVVVTAPSVDAAIETVAVPAGVVDVRTIDPSIRVDLMYLGSDNFLGRPAAGYHANVCYLTEPAARALAAANARLAARKLALLVRDCYRPQRAVDDFVRWVDDTDDVATRDAYYPGLTKRALIEQGYIAPASGHSRGGAVDVTIVDATTDAPLDMGSAIDFFGARSHTAHADLTSEQRAARDLLLDVMTPAFENLPVEWWHYAVVPNDHAPMDFEIRPTR